MTRPRALLAALLVAALGLAACGPSDGGSNVTPGADGAAADRAPADGGPTDAGGAASSDPGGATDADLDRLRFTASTVDGGEVDTAALLASGPVAFWAWAPWCSTCNREAPTVKEVHARFGEQVAFVGVAGRDSLAPMKTFVERHELGAMVHAVDRDGDLWRRLGVPGQPMWVLVDRDGGVERLFGMVDADTLSERLAALAG